MVEKKSKSQVSRRKRATNQDVCQKIGPAQYITGEWNNPRVDFLVGDGQKYNGHENKPLVEGETYTIYYCVGSEVNEVGAFVYIMILNETGSH